MNIASILIVEDDQKMQRLLSSQLTARSYEVNVVDNGPEALALVRERIPDLVLLDVSLPGMDGIQVCRQLRTITTVPIILVTVVDTPQTKVLALELGADDYLCKPFHMEELVARIRAVLRRTTGEPPQAPTMVEVAGIEIDLQRREVHRGQQEIHLTKIEFDLLQELVTHMDRVLTYKYLLQAAWGSGYDDARLVHVHICNLRRKLEQGPTHPRYILAVPGVGYRLRLPDPA